MFSMFGRSIAWIIFWAVFLTCMSLLALEVFLGILEAIFSPGQSKVFFSVPKAWIDMFDNVLPYSHYFGLGFFFAIVGFCALTASAFALQAASFINLKKLFLHRVYFYKDDVMNAVGLVCLSIMAAHTLYVVLTGDYNDPSQIVSQAMRVAYFTAIPTFIIYGAITAVLAIIRLVRKIKARRQGSELTL